MRGTAALVAVAALVLSGCTRGLDEPVVVRETTAADCAAVIPADVVRGLVWQSTAAPTYDLGTCTLTGDDGTIAVQELPATDYDARCGALRPDGGAGSAVDWLGDDVEACAAVSGDGSGVNVLLAFARDDLLVEVRVLSARPASAGQVRHSLVALEEAAADRL